MLPKADNTWTIFEAAHLLNRAGFGGSPAEIEAFHRLGRSRAVDSLLAPEEAPDAFPLPSWTSEEQIQEDMRKRMAERREAMRDRRGMSNEELEKARRLARREVQRELRARGVEAQSWWFRRMLKTRAPLREKMTLFWHDHFATSIQKVRDPYLLIRQNELFRTHAVGSFKSLTHAILMDGAMMLYLDTQNSRKGKPNENFAREVMELFTLGEGQYTEDDIRDAARAFTGYQLDRMNGSVTHNRRQWDDGPKTIFGKSGAFDGSDVIDLIFEQDQAARFMVGKLWEFFVYERPAKAAVDALAATLRRSDYRIAPVLREIFLSREFYAEASIRSQIKSPLQFLIQMLKQLEISDPPAGFALNAQQQLGQTLFLPPNVAGWDWGQAWINTNTLLSRYNLAGFLTKGAESSASEREAGRAAGQSMMMAAERRAQRAQGAWRGPDYEAIAPRPLREDPAKLVDALVFRFFQGPVPEKAKISFIEYAEAKKGVIFTNKETAELCHLMLSTPYYQLT
jgi:uncharacterized protein (DUF1800 family)